MRRFLTLSFVILLSACGSTGPSSMVGVTLVRASPAPGSTITLLPSGADLTAQVSMTFTVVSDKDIPFPIAEVEWDAGGESCGIEPFITDLPVPMKANEPQTVTARRVVWRTKAGGSFVCPLPTTTSLIRVTVGDFCFCDNPATFSRELAISYSFVASTPAGS